MKTFTNDSLLGKMNPETKWIEEKTRRQLRGVIEGYLNDCIENDVEMTSADGLFFEMVFQELVEIRSKEISKRKSEK